MKKRLVIVGLMAMLILGMSNFSHADLINGDFSNNLTGWFTEDMDTSFSISNPSQSIKVETGRAVMRTQGYDLSSPASNIMFSLYQPVNIPTDSTTFNFDFDFNGGAQFGTGVLPDYFQVSFIDNNLNQTTLMGFNAIVNYYNLDSSFTGFSAAEGLTRLTFDLSTFAGLSGSIYFDLIDELDSFSSTAFVDNVTFNTTPVPEPSTMMLLGSGLIGLIGFGRKRFFRK